MIDGSEKCNRQLAFELQNWHVCEKRSKKARCTNKCLKNIAEFSKVAAKLDLKTCFS